MDFFALVAIKVEVLFHLASSWNCFAVSFLAPDDSIGFGSVKSAFFDAMLYNMNKERNDKKSLKILNLMQEILAL